MKKYLDEFRCKKCGIVREPIDFDDVPGDKKEVVAKMMEAMNPILASNNDLPAFIVYCQNCNEYSTLILQ